MAEERAVRNVSETQAHTILGAKKGEREEAHRHAKIRGGRLFLVRSHASPVPSRQPLTMRKVLVWGLVVLPLLSRAVMVSFQGPGVSVVPAILPVKRSRLAPALLLRVSDRIAVPPDRARPDRLVKRIVVVALRLSVQRTIAPLVTAATGVFCFVAANLVGLMLSPVSLTAAGNGSLSRVNRGQRGGEVDHAGTTPGDPDQAADGR